MEANEMILDIAGLHIQCDALGTWIMSRPARGETLEMSKDEMALLLSVAATQSLIATGKAVLTTCPKQPGR